MPPAVGWTTALTTAPLTAAQRRFREELGLPATGTVVMSGHQAEVWHPGIVAKWFAMKSLAAAHGAHAAWVVVDQDDNDPTRIKYPTNDLERRTLGVERPAKPTGARPAEAHIAAVPEDCAAPARDGLARLLNAVNAHASAPTLADQYTRAACDLLGRHAEGVKLVRASRLQHTTLFREFVHAMRADGAAVRLYNRAVQETGRAGGVRTLHSDPARGEELPLWRMHPSGVRLAIYSNDAIGSDESLAPRALVLTALFRIAGCELFIHGLGGGVYDRVTDRWLELMHQDPATHALVGTAPPAPTCVVSATRYLPLGSNSLATPEAIAHAAWHAHRAKFDPLIFSDRAAAERKTAALRVMSSATTRADKLAAYRSLHAVLHEYRAAHTGQLERLDALAESARQSRHTASVVYDRTWPFPYFGDDTLAALASDVAAAVQ